MEKNREKNRKEKKKQKTNKKQTIPQKSNKNKLHYFVFVKFISTYQRLRDIPCQKNHFHSNGID